MFTESLRSFGKLEDHPLPSRNCYRLYNNPRIFTTQSRCSGAVSPRRYIHGGLYLQYMFYMR